MWSGRFSLQSAFFCATAGVLGVGARTAAAQVPAPTPAAAAEPSAVSETATVTARPKVFRSRYWEDAPVRPFLAATMESGMFSLKTQLAAGYGRPFDSFVGIEGYAKISTGALSEAVGVRAALPWIQAGVALRYTTALARDYLEPKDSYTRHDAELNIGQSAHDAALDADLSLRLTVPFGKLALAGNWSYVVAVPDGYYLFEESVRAIIDPPHVLRGRAAYELEVGNDGFVYIGPLVDALYNPGRNAVFLRVGPTARVALSPRLEAFGTLTFLVTSPDELGLLGGDATQIGLRFRWATDTLDPRQGARAVARGRSAPGE